MTALEKIRSAHEQTAPGSADETRQAARARNATALEAVLNAAARREITRLGLDYDTDAIPGNRILRASATRLLERDHLTPLDLGLVQGHGAAVQAVTLTGITDRMFFLNFQFTDGGGTPAAIADLPVTATLHHGDTGPVPAPGGFDHRGTRITTLTDIPL